VALFIIAVIGGLLLLTGLIGCGVGYGVGLALAGTSAGVVLVVVSGLLTAMTVLVSLLILNWWRA
jgi:hypothetical protein